VVSFLLALAPKCLATARDDKVTDFTRVVVVVIC
jgi:hypothetical protein